MLLLRERQSMLMHFFMLKVAEKFFESFFPLLIHFSFSNYCIVGCCARKYG